MILSENLSVAEFSKSDTAKRKGIDNTPKGVHLEAAKELAQNIFQPIREHFAVPLFISSGYRSDALNKAVGGSATSQHSNGEAIDIDMGNNTKPSNKDLFDYIKKNLEFDQLIWEFGTDKNPEWIHVSYSSVKNRKKILKAVKVNGRTHYENF